MDLYQLRIVRELSELGSLSAVAARLSVTTSAVSQQLRALQDEMGEQLVAKSGRTLVLNEAGRVLAAAAVQVWTSPAQSFSSAALCQSAKASVEQRTAGAMRSWAAAAASMSPCTHCRC